MFVSRLYEEHLMTPDIEFVDEKGKGKTITEA